MINATVTDIVVTVIGAMGCAFYFHFLWQQNEGRHGIRASLFLFGTLTLLLALRAPFWYYGVSILGRFVFAAATLLPLAVTLFCEQLLRRHHPLWLKILALITTAGFFLTNLAGNLHASPVHMWAFLACFLIVLAANVFLLIRTGDRDIASSELQIVRAVIVTMLISLPLVVSDFRQDIPLFPFRLGALGALLLVCVVLNASIGPRATARLIGRLLLAFLAACALSGFFALAITGADTDFIWVAISGIPISLAWMLLTTIVVRVTTLFAQSSDNRFLSWLLDARMDNADEFLESLKHFPQTSEYVVLKSDVLSTYSLDMLFALDRKEPVNIAEARAWQREGIQMDEAEQLIDMLEKYGMTHALLVSREPSLIVLMRFPQGIHSSIGKLRAAVIQRIARQLPQNLRKPHSD